VIFALAFIAGAIITFGAAAFIGAAVRMTDLPLGWRAGCAAAILCALGSVDLLAIRRRSYCPLGRRRQTPQALLFLRAPLVVAATWGFDTGLAVTTIRVGAITWGALILPALGLASWWAGFGYGLGFVVPLLVAIWKQPSAEAQSRMKESYGMSLERQLGRRALAQLASAALLFVAAVTLLVRVFLRA
jgi:hypothetical protein